MTKLTGIRACLFDAYGTVLDFASAVSRCAEVPEDRRAALTALWRDKQLQYTWLRTIQGRYADFAQITADALDFALEALDLHDPQRRAALLALYRRLDCFPEVPGMLRRLKERGLLTAILSNGTPSMLEESVRAAGLDGAFDAIFSVDSLGLYKTDRRVYQYALDRLGLPATAISFQSSNGWDAYAASDFGMRVVWCNRAGQPAERLPGKPDVMVRTLAELPDLLA